MEGRAILIDNGKRTLEKDVWKDGARRVFNHGKTRRRSRSMPWATKNNHGFRDWKEPDHKSQRDVVVI